MTGAERPSSSNIVILPIIKSVDTRKVTTSDDERLENHRAPDKAALPGGVLDDGRICLTNNAAERALRGIAVGRCNSTFAGSDRGADRAAALYTLIETARLNDVDPRAWLADVLARINDHPAKAIDDLLPWNWKAGNQADMYGPFPDGKDFLAWYR